MKLTRKFPEPTSAAVRAALPFLAAIAMIAVAMPAKAACSFESVIELREQRAGFRDARNRARDGAAAAEQAAREAFRDFRADVRRHSEVRVNRCELELEIGDPSARPGRGGDGKTAGPGLNSVPACDPSAPGNASGLWILFAGAFDDAFYSARRLVWSAIDGSATVTGASLMEKVSKFRAGYLPAAQRKAVARAAILFELHLAIQRVLDRYTDAYDARECLSAHRSEVVRIGNALPFADADRGMTYVRTDPIAMRDGCGDFLFEYHSGDWSRNEAEFTPVPRGYEPLVTFMEALQAGMHELRASRKRVGRETWDGLRSALSLARPLHLELAEYHIDASGVPRHRGNLDTQDRIIADLIATHQSSLSGDARALAFGQLIENWYCEKQLMRELTETTDRVYFRDARIRTVYTDTSGLFHRNLNALIKTWSNNQDVAAEDLTRLERILDTLP